VLLLEQLAEPLPRHARGVGVQPVVKFVLQVRPRLLGTDRVVRLGGLAPALAGDRVVPFEREVGPVGPVLNPDDYAILWHRSPLGVTMQRSISYAPRRGP